MAHTFSNILVHVIFSTKKRRSLILEPFRERLWAYMGGLAREELGTARIVGGTENHVHELLSLKTTISPAKAMERWKSLSTGWVHRTFPEASDFGWQVGYGMFSVSESNAPAVIRYIEGQAEHHRTTTFEEEYVKFLQKHNIDYDPRYVWD